MESQNFTSNAESVDDVSTRLTITIPAAKVDQELQVALNKATQKANIKGFRAGKAPKNIVEKLHGAAIRADVAEKLITTTLYEVIKEQQLETVGLPKVDAGSVENGKEFQYTALVALLPRPEVKNYQEFNIKVPLKQVENEDVDKFIERLKSSKVSLKKVEFRTQAQKGDVVSATISVSMEGDKTPPAAEPIDFALGEGKLPEEVELEIEGMELGETKQFTAPLPIHTRNKDKKDKLANYKVTLIAIQERQYPNLDDEFAVSLDWGVNTFLELRLKARELLEKECQERAKQRAEELVLDELISRNPLNVPDDLVDQEIRNLILRSGLIDPRKTDINRISLEPFRKDLTEIALKRVRGAILADQLAKKENIEVSEQEYNQRIKEIAEENEVSEQDVINYLEQERNSNAVKIELLRGKVLEFLIQRAKIEHYQPEKNEQGGDATKSENAG